MKHDADILRSNETKRRLARRRSALKARITMWERKVATATPAFSQVQHLIKKFGGIMPFCQALKVFPGTVTYFWIGGSERNTTKHRTFCDGLIPLIYIPRLINSARSFGILLSPADLFPDFVDGNTVQVRDIKRWEHLVPKPKKARDFEDLLATLAGAVE